MLLSEELLSDSVYAFHLFRRVGSNMAWFIAAVSMD